MIYFSDNEYKFYTSRVEFLSSEYGKQWAYCTDTSVQDYIDMVKAYPWQFSNLSHAQVEPTTEQKERLNLLNDLKAEHKNTYESECVLFVEHGAILEDTRSEFLIPLKDQYASITADYLERVRMQEAKAKRQGEIDTIIVTTAAGNSFDGDEASQTRMTRAITSLQPGETMPWVLADNVAADVSKEELQEALRLAGTVQTEIWLRPYSV